MSEAFLLTRALLQFGDERDDLRGNLSTSSHSGKKRRGLWPLRFFAPNRG